MAVTTNLNINFMRKPEPGDLMGEGRLLKLGKTLAVGDFTIWSEGQKDPVAHATVTYCDSRRNINGLETRYYNTVNPKSIVISP